MGDQVCTENLNEEKIMKRQPPPLQQQYLKFSHKQKVNCLIRIHLHTELLVYDLIYLSRITKTTLRLKSRISILSKTNGLLFNKDIYWNACVCPYSIFSDNQKSSCNNKVIFQFLFKSKVDFLNSFH